MKAKDEELNLLKRRSGMVKQKDLVEYPLCPSIEDERKNYCSSGKYDYYSLDENEGQ